MSVMKGMREFWDATKRGARISRKKLWGALEVLSIVSLLVGIITAPFYTSLIHNPWYKGITWFFVVCVILIIAWVIGLMPYWGMREMKHDVDKELDRLSPLKQLQQLQERDLLEASGNAYFDVMVKRINLSKKHADVEFYVVNGNTFPLMLTWQFKETTLTFEGDSTPVVVTKSPDMPKPLSALPAGRTESQLAIRLFLDQDDGVFPRLLNCLRSKYVKWQFRIVVTLMFDGKTKEVVRSPDWEGIHYDRL